ncbi:exonuclease domain-containing protein [Streptomyces sp. SID11385]|uniref:exonuclease domain-containing protein n=1 Tax=Streptomyces sp. SID11385 TaxID=2706031 RepID=UPI0013CAB3C6|nr:3'-5' exonuclease [Streptomyces sp. SID11385]
MTAWHTGRLAAFDLETTGVDVETARIVTACVAQVGGGALPETRSWLADPGVEIPDEAAAVHGITTDRARAEGRPAVEVVEEITALLHSCLLVGAPVVAMNARYDLTLLDRECRRHERPTLADRLGGTVRPVLDPLVLDRQVDRYRRGKRTLTALAEHYRVPLDGAHDAMADAVAAARIVWRLGHSLPRLAAMSLDELHDAQIEWAESQAVSLAAHFRERGETVKAAGVRPEWPLIPAPRDGGGA